MLKSNAGERLSAREWRAPLLANVTLADALAMEASSKSSSRSKHKKKDKKRHRPKSSKSKKHSKKRRRRSSSRESSSSSSNTNQPVEKAGSSIEINCDKDFHNYIINENEYSHEEAVQFVKQSLNGLLTADPLLSDLPPNVTLEEVRLLIAHEHGQAIRVVLEREDRTFLPVIVLRDATIRELKRAVEKATELKLSRDIEEKPDRPPKKSLNWKYVWKSYYLSADGRKLKDDDATHKDCSINNNDRLCFVKRLREK